MNYFYHICKACRPYQWVKNVLIFAPLFLAHRYGEQRLLIQALLGFFSFSFCASAVYIINDLKDRDADRAHPQKKSRPFASGSLSLSSGILIALTLMAASYFLSSFLPYRFGLLVLVYFAVALSYTYVFKEVVILDVIVLALLYTLRLFAGAKAVDVVLSKWFFVFAIFLFTMLAFVKRFAELKNNKELAVGKNRRNYMPADVEQIAMLGSASGTMAVLVLALYISSQDVMKLYARPQILWLLCPIMLYWVSRLWLISHRGQMHDDPVLFALKDVSSYVVAVLSLIIVMLAV